VEQSWPHLYMPVHLVNSARSAASRTCGSCPAAHGGGATGTAGLTVIALIPALPAVLVGWCVAQLGFNATLSALSATIPDQVPAHQRGRVSRAVGFSLLISVPLGAGGAPLGASAT
jgi:hypothetical protein